MSDNASTGPDASEHAGAETPDLQPVEPGAGAAGSRAHWIGPTGRLTERAELEMMQDLIRKRRAKAEGDSAEQVEVEMSQDVLREQRARAEGDSTSPGAAAAEPGVVHGGGRTA